MYIYINFATQNWQPQDTPTAGPLPTRFYCLVSGRSVNRYASNKKMRDCQSARADGWINFNQQNAVWLGAAGSGTHLLRRRASGGVK